MNGHCPGCVAFHDPHENGIPERARWPYGVILNIDWGDQKPKNKAEFIRRWAESLLRDNGPVR